MRKAGVFSVAVLLLALAVPVAAQEEGPLSMMYFVKVKSGMALQFEEALRAHVAWLGQQNEQWPWGIWMRAAGDDLGVYAIGSFGHTFEHFDARGALWQSNRQHWLSTVSQYVESISGHVSVMRADISRPMEGMEGPAPLAWVIGHQLKVGTEEEFNHAAKRIHEAIVKTNWPVHYEWVQVIAGGPSPSFALVIPGQKWTDFNQPEEPFRAMLEKAYGREGAQALIDIFDKITVSESSAIYVYRADLSYMPPPM